MALAKQTSATSNESVLLDIDKIVQSINQENIQCLMDAINKEIGKRRLEKKEIEELQLFMSIDALDATRLTNVADVLKYLSVFAVAESNPESFKIIIEIILEIIGRFYPIAKTAHGILTKVPTPLFATLIKIGGLASPEYLIYQGINTIATRKLEKARSLAEQSIFAHENMTNLIIVCKNKLLYTEMDKLIKLEDDLDDETIVGTKDGSVHTIIWNESAWEVFRHKLTSNDKILIIGKIKNTISLNADQTRFENFGVTYGWNKNVAIIESNRKALSSAKNYNDFLCAVNALQIPEKLKKNAKLKLDWLTVGKTALFPPLLLGDVLHQKSTIEKQQLLFGIYTFYTQHLSEFLTKSENE